MLIPIIIGVGALIGLWLFLSLLFKVVVPQNEVHIIQRTKENVPYGKGQEAGASYYKWPSWLPIIGVERIILPVSIFSIPLDGYSAYDSGKVPFVTDIKAWFYINDPQTASQRISDFEELKDQLDDILKGAVRKILASDNIEEIMTGRGKYGVSFIDEVEQQTKAFGVTTKNIEFMDIRDPDDSTSEVVSNIMAKKKSEIEKDSRIEVAKNKQLSEVAEIESEKMSSLKREESEEFIGKRKAEKEAIVGLAQEEARQKIMESSKQTKSREMEVIEIETIKTAEIEKAKNLLKSQEEAEIAKIDAEGKKNQAIIEAETQKSTEETISEGKRIADVKKAEGIKSIGFAEAETTERKKLAEITAEIKMAQEIGANQAYIDYLVELERIKADKEIGIKKAEALSNSDLKIIANGQGDGTVNGGLTSIMDIFTGKGGTNLGNMLENLKNIPAGKELIDKVLNSATKVKTEEKGKTTEVEVINKKEEEFKKKRFKENHVA